MRLLGLVLLGAAPSPALASVKGAVGSRAVAQAVLVRTARDAAYADRALESELRKARPPLTPADAKHATAVVYGVMRQRAYLDFALGQLAGPDVADRSDERTIAALRIGAFELLFMRTPPHAAVNSAVALEKRKGVRGFVNGVLRNLSRRQAAGTLAEPEASLSPIDALATRSNVPVWLLAEMRSLLPSDEDIAWPPAQEAPPLALRVCTSRAEPDAVTSALGELGAEIRRWDPIPAALHVTKAGDPRSLPGFSEGHWTVQDPGAQLVGHLAAPSPGDVVLDLCAAPGGKTAHLAEMVGDTGTVQTHSSRAHIGSRGRQNNSAHNNAGAVVAVDLKSSRLRLLASSAKRLGVSGRITPVTADATDASKLKDALRQHANTEAADVVVLDAPCSGLGTLRRHAELRGTRREKSSELAALQDRLLDAAAECVRVGGSLTYSARRDRAEIAPMHLGRAPRHDLDRGPQVCTPVRAECDDRVRAFLGRHPKFELAPPDDSAILGPFWAELIADGDGGRGSGKVIRSWTHRDGCDSFFAARLVRRDE